MTPTLYVGDYGVNWQWPSTRDLTGQTVKLRVQHPSGSTTILDMIVGTTTIIKDGISYPAGFWAYRLTLNTDVPTQGPHLGQLFTTDGLTYQIAGNAIAFTVGAAI